MMRRIVILLCMLTAALDAAGQAVPFLTIRMDAGEQAFGGAHVASRNLLPLSDNIFEAGLGKTLWQTGGINYNLTNILARVRIVENLTAGIEYTSNNMGEMTLYSDNGQPMGTFQPGEMMAALRLSYSPSKKLNLNAAGKIIRSSLTDDHTGRCYAADLGAVYRINNAFAAGLAIENLGGKINYGYGAYPLPTTCKAGIDGTVKLKDKHAVEFAADGGFMPAGSALLASLGTGYVYNDMFSVRCGAHICTKDTVLPSYFSAGIYFKSTNFDIGAAWLSAANTYSISARLKL
ncbi:MAG: PorV/PorQ family protein [Bacteroidales bacterium]|nr:PorV/PorQ family protein [Bacteroidales bacterium]